MRRKILWWLVVSIMVYTAGCNPVQPMTPQSTPRETPMPTHAATSTLPKAVKTLVVVPSTQITQVNTVNIQLPSSNPLVVQAMKDLARRLTVGLDEITVIRAEAVVWSDGGLGCPRPGMAYIQVQQEGMRIVLSVAGKEYHYHSGETRPPFLCENPTPSE